MLTLEQIERLAALNARATSGPWEWWTSNSWRRLTAQGGRDGGVICPVVHPVDHHPDLAISEPDMALIAEARNALPDLLALARDAYRFRAWVNAIEADARQALKGDDNERKGLCERIIIGNGNECANAEDENLHCYCSWREEKLKAERDKLTESVKKFAATAATYQTERNELALLLADAVRLCGWTDQEWVKPAREALAKFGGDANPENEP